MGRLNHDPCIHHFSHPHGLHLSSNLQSPHSLAHCSACQLNSSGWMYSCYPCNFSLHLSCSQLPSLITHPSHPIHTLTLFPSPVYPGGAFNCDACGHDGHGFTYHCTHCGFDLHTTCAQNPLSVTNQYHPHLLQLTFQAPYQTKGFSCDICQKIGSNHWLYRCGPCEFDAHMECALAVLPAPSCQPQQYGNRAANPPAGPRIYAQSLSMGAMQGSYQQPVAGNNNAVMDAIVQGFLDGAAQQAGQNFVQSLMGGGDGGSGNGNFNGDPNASGGGDGDTSFSIGSSVLSGIFGDSNSEN